jgi:acetolactate synthase-1/2/3 large subunit
VIPPQGDDAALAELARMPVSAENPVIICDRMGANPGRHDAAGRACRNAAVHDNFGRMNFPSRHPLNMSFRRSVISQADVILAMEVNELWGSLNSFGDRIVRTSSPNYKKTAKICTLGSRDLYLKANYQDFGRYQEGTSQAMPKPACRP